MVLKSRFYGGEGGRFAERFTRISDNYFVDKNNPSVKRFPAGARRPSRPPGGRKVDGLGDDDVEGILV